MRVYRIELIEHKIKTSMCEEVRKNVSVREWYKQNIIHLYFQCLSRMMFRD